MFPKEVWMVIVRYLDLNDIIQLRLVSKKFDVFIKHELRSRALMIDNARSIAELIDFIYHENELTYVICDNKSYFPRTDTWTSRSVDNSNNMQMIPELFLKRGTVDQYKCDLDRSHDPNIICNGYSDCEYEDYSEYLVAKDCLEKKELDRWIELKELNDEDDLSSEDDEEFRELKAEIKDGIKIIEPEDLIKYVFNNNKILTYKNYELVYFPNDVKIYNNMGINDDHRGSNHYNIQLDYSEEYTFDKGFHSIYDIVQGCFRLLSHKNDGNYGMICNFIHEDEDDNDNIESNIIQTKSGNWIVSLIIDHGS